MKTLLAASVLAGTFWVSLWFTPDQYGQRLFDQGEFTAAAEAFEDPMRIGTAWFRAGEFEKAEQAFARLATPQAEFNRGNCLIMRGKYEAAIERFDHALQLHPDWEDAETNRAIAVARAEQTKQTGGDQGDQKIGADEVVFDKNKKQDGQDTDVNGEQPVSDTMMQALWLRRVQTKPAEFLKAKFAFQLANESNEAEE